MVALSDSEPWPRDSQHGAPDHQDWAPAPGVRAQSLYKPRVLVSSLCESSCVLGLQNGMSDPGNGTTLSERRAQKDCTVCSSCKTLPPCWSLWLAFSQSTCPPGSHPLTTHVCPTITSLGGREGFFGYLPVISFSFTLDYLACLSFFLALSISWHLRVIHLLTSSLPSFTAGSPPTENRKSLSIKQILHWPIASQPVDLGYRLPVGKAGSLGPLTIVQKRVSVALWKEGETVFSGPRSWGLCSHQALPPCGQWVRFSQQLVSGCGQQVQRPGVGRGGWEMSTLQHPTTLRFPVTLN